MGMAVMLPMKYFVKNEEKSNKKKVNYLVMFVPSLCDVCATIFDSTGLIYVI
jgi:hypothetical protein